MMTVAKKPDASRRYRSPLREEQARRTHAAVIEAATACFVEKGYAATTMKDVAARAGVSVETVYGQGGKASLLLAAVDRTLAGDDTPVPVIERAPLREVMESPDAHAALRRFRDVVVEGMPKALPLMHAFHVAAGGDAEIGAAYQVYEQRRLTDMTKIAESLEAGLRVPTAEAADVIWALFSTPAIHALMVDRGWGVERWADWVISVLERTLLD
ncbi:TetR/AcrR family transcriptional regulator [Herbidospora sp. NBRC 101105]|uniref:TetR/AcrR family transcriptional regulator n=1 Tax=Herbidospora sp. NBRC 101105 TaxID=3032195 RepID=UPI00255711DE|nr:TetR/AcrR family transcriptional regulator [Herbidospora sp. NBRC 101105]